MNNPFTTHFSRNNVLRVAIKCSSASFCKGLMTGAAILLLATVAPLAWSAPYAYVANSNGNSVSIIDTANDTVKTTIAVGTSPYGVAVSPDASHVYITNAGSNTVSVIATASDTIVATIPVDTWPTGIAVSPDGNRAFVSNSVSDAVSVIDTANNTVIATVPVGGFPNSVAVSPDGNRVYVTNKDGNTVSVIDTASDTVVATIAVGSFPNSVVESPDGRRAYVVNNGGNTISVIDTMSDTLVATIPVGTSPYGVAVSPDGGQIYVTNKNDDTVSVIDTTIDSAIGSPITVGGNPSGVTISPDGSQAYVTNANDNTVSVINTTSHTVTATVSVGGTPLGIYIGRGALIAANSSQSGSASNQVSGTVPTLTNTTACATTDTVVENPARGSLSFNGGGSFTYTPSSSTYSGPDAFTWLGHAPLSCTAADDPNIPVSNTATVSLILEPLLTGLGDITVGEGQTLQQSFSLTGTTPFTHALTSDNTTVLPATGLSISPGTCGNDAAHLSCTLDITPAPSAGTAGVIVAATDKYGDTVSQHFTVTVVAPPAVTSLAPAAVTAPATVSETFTVTGTGTLSVAATSSNTTLLPDANITGQNNCTAAGSCTLTLTPAADQAGGTAITVTASDAYGQSGNGSFTLTVNAPATPTVSGLSNFSILEGQNGTETFTISGSGALTLTTTSSNTTLLPNADITGQSNCTAAGSCTITLTPVANQSGTATVMLIVTDGYGQTGTGSITLTVNQPSAPPPPPPPTAAPTVSGLSNLTLTAGQTGSESFALSGTGVLTLTATSSDTTLLPNADITGLGSCAASGGCALSLTPAVDQTGSAVVNLTVANGTGQSSSASFTLTVNPPAAPTMSGLSDLTLATGMGGSESFAVRGTGVLTLTATSSNTTLLPDANITGQGSCTAAGVCTLSLKPAANETGTATVTVSAADAYGQSTQETFTVSVQASSSGMNGGAAGGGGGGSPLGLLVLAGLVVFAWVRRRWLECNYIAVIRALCTRSTSLMPHSVDSKAAYEHTLQLNLCGGRAMKAASIFKNAMAYYSRKQKYHQLKYDWPQVEYTEWEQSSADDAWKSTQRTKSGRGQFKRMYTGSAYGALVAVVALAASSPVWADGSNSTTPLPQPTAPTALTPSTTPLTTVGSGGCAGQYTNKINALNTTAGVISTVTGGIQIGLDGLDGVLFGVDAATVDEGASPISLALQAVDKTGIVLNDIAGEVGNGITNKANALTDYSSTLPNCDQAFAGTVTVTAGGVNVTGPSIFNSNVSFAQDVSVAGTLSASQISTSQGISADGGAIWIGDTNGTTYSSGITIGGGALSGAGTGGLEAYTGDPTAIAIGNNAQADQAGSLALGLNSVASGVSATAVGNNAQASQTGSVAVGFGAVATGVSGTAVGNQAQALADQTVAIGAGAVVMAGSGPGAFAGGTSEVLSGSGAVAVGDSNSASGDGAVSIGDPNVATGTGAVAIGASNTATGQGATATGNMDTATGQGAVASGNLDTATGQGAIAIGDQNTANGAGAIAEGQGSSATADGSIALGKGASADASNSTAIGSGATVPAGDINSTAIGAGATATNSNQIMLGTASQTVTAPGIDSNLSRSRQVGGLGLVTSDSQGNLASDGGTLFRHLAATEAGVAIAMAIPNPIVTSTHRHALMMNVATYYGAYSVGFSGSSFLDTGLLRPGDSLAFSMALGWGKATEEGYTESQVGARIGLEYSW